jgi:hypothetical protein
VSDSPVSPSPDVTWLEVPDPGDGPRTGEVNPKERLNFAKSILFWLAFLFILGMAAFVLSPDKGEKIFDACKTVLPPIATLVIAYYFQK